MHRCWTVEPVVSHYVGRGCGAWLGGAGKTQPHRCCSPLRFGEEWATVEADGQGQSLAKLHGTWAQGAGAHPRRQLPLGTETGRGWAAPVVSTPAEQQTDTGDCTLFHRGNCWFGDHFSDENQWLGQWFSTPRRIFYRPPLRLFSSLFFYNVKAEIFSSVHSWLCGVKEGKPARWKGKKSDKAHDGPANQSTSQS